MNPRTIILAFLFFLSTGVYSFSPVLTFMPPTPNNASSLTDDWTQANMTIDTSSLSTFKFNWNKTNYTIYDDSLVVSYSFNNNSAIGENSTKVLDISKYSNNGTWGNSSTGRINYSTGKFGTGIQFDGKDDYIYSNRFGLAAPSQITVEAWVKSPLVGTGHGTIISSLEDNSLGTLWIFRASNTNSLYWEYSDSTVSYRSMYVPDYFSGYNNVFIHMAVTADYNSGVVTFYRNGVSVYTENMTTPVKLTKNQFWIGEDGAGQNFFNGTIDEFRVYKRSLSAVEILLHYQTEFSRYNTTQYRFYSNITNLTAGTYTYYGWANDSSGNSNYTPNSPRYLVTPQSAFSIFVVPAITDYRILTNTAVSLGYLSNEVTMAASPGEFEPASFVLKSNVSRSNVVISVSNLTTSGGARINASYIDISVVKLWYQGRDFVSNDEWPIPTDVKLLKPELLLKDDSLVKVVGTDNYLKVNGNYVLISSPSGIAGLSSQESPTAIEFPITDAASLQPVNLTPNENKQFWITVKVPDNAIAGTYNGTITIRNAIGVIDQLTLTVIVLPINLSESSITYSIFYMGHLDSSAYISDTLKSQQQMNAELKDMHDHGVTNPNMYPQDDLATVNHILDMRSAAGLQNNPLYYLGIGDAWWDYPLVCSMSPTAFKNEITNFKNAVAAKGVNDVYFYLTDEADLDTVQCRALIQAAHDVGGKVTDSQGWPYAKKVADMLDLVNVAYDLNRTYPPVIHNYAGHKIFSYTNPQPGYEQPSVYRKNYGLSLWQYGYDGGTGWAYQGAYDTAIWDDFDAQDNVFAYPTSTGVIDTIEWEGWREGVDDVRYMTTLQNTIRIAKAGGKNTAAAENFVAGVNSSDLSTQDLDAIRAQMVSYILALQNGSTTTSTTTSSSMSTSTTTTPTSTTSTTLPPCVVVGCGISCQNNCNAQWGADQCSMSGDITCINSCPVCPTTTSTTSSSLVSSSTSTSSTTIRTTSTSSSTTVPVTTTSLSVCVIPGNYYPCDSVSLQEVVDAINMWAKDNLRLIDVIYLINSWADPITHPPN